jgi:hypothetical protein
MLFFLTFYLVYLAMHGLVWLRVGFQLELSRRAKVLGWVAAALLAATPFFGYMLPDHWPQPVARVAWWAIYLWFAAVFYLFWLQMLAMVLQFVLRFLPGRAGRWFPRGRRQVAAVVLATLAIMGWGLYEASQWEIPRYEIASSTVERDVRLVMVSDLHLGALTSEVWVERLARAVRDLRPDLVLFAGDQVNDHLHWLDDEARLLAALDPPLGVFGVTGNHEHYVDRAASRRFHRLAGVCMLRNETALLEDAGILLAGVDDPARGGDKRADLAKAMETLGRELDPERFTVLLSHRPWAWDTAAALGADLMLSGHTHGGQLLPFNWFTRLSYPYLAGLIVGRGAGVWGPPIRVGAAPQIVVVDVVPRSP